ncbi:hypothetical protein BpHYR1_050616 [Brachionus plicatilis]|uniref:Uncharacterized protein n=1 Tax=Brachionus plicatilis TaxID=10195 RepID=A0A3M7QDC4_BRAPC|nr:hypothetical protein BpHYR1_050616 [Brachionus plicatilis]
MKIIDLNFFMILLFSVNDLKESNNSLITLFIECFDQTIYSEFLLPEHKIGLKNTLQFSAFCTPLKSILINCASTLQSFCRQL